MHGRLNEILKHCNEKKLDDELKIDIQIAMAINGYNCLKIDDHVGFMHLIQDATRVYGAASGRFFSKIPAKSKKEAQKKEILDMVNKILSRNPSLKRTSATRIALTSLRYPVSMLRNLRRSPKK